MCFQTAERVTPNFSESAAPETNAPRCEKSARRISRSRFNEEGYNPTGRRFQLGLRISFIPFYAILNDCEAVRHTHPF